MCAQLVPNTRQKVIVEQFVMSNYTSINLLTRARDFLTLQLVNIATRMMFEFPLKD